MSQTKTKDDEPKQLPLNCHQYKQLMLSLKREKQEPTVQQRSAMANHRKLCSKHLEDAGWSRLLHSLRKGAAPADPKELDPTMSPDKLDHNLGVLHDALTDVAPRKKKRP